MPVLSDSFSCRATRVPARPPRTGRLPPAADDRGHDRPPVLRDGPHSAAQPLAVRSPPPQSPANLRSVEAAPDPNCVLVKISAATEGSPEATALESTTKPNII